MKVWIPLCFLVLTVFLFLLGLRNDPSYIPSALIDKKAPEFSLKNLDSVINKQNDFLYTTNSWKGKVWILNIFASWCLACNVEHPVLMKISKEHPKIELVGLAYKDEPLETRKWLKQNGNPYSTVLVDINGNVGLDYGVYGVPETYIIDSVGKIKYRHVGPIQPDFFEEFVSPLIE